MEYTIVHRPEVCRFSIEMEGSEAYVEIVVMDNAGELIIVHTIVPSPLEGRGLASALVAAAYKYADEKCLKRVAVCEYAKKWLEKHSDG